MDIRQSFAAGEDLFSHHSYRIRHHNMIQGTASIECPVPDLCHSTGEIDRFQYCTAGECFCSDLFDRIRQFHRSQHEIVFECAFSNLCNRMSGDLHRYDQVFLGSGKFSDPNAVVIIPYVIKVDTLGDSYFQ